MKIALIGAGNVGRALGGSLVRAGHGVTPAASNLEAVETAEIVVLAVPYAGAEEVAREIAAAAAGKIVIDVTNPVKPTYDGLATENGPSAAERIQAWIPGATVVKAINTLLASRQADPIVDGVQVDGFYATDASDAAATVGELLRSIGLRPIHVGGLRFARELEALAWLNMSIGMRYKLDWQSAFKLVGVPAGATLVPQPEKASP